MSVCLICLNPKAIKNLTQLRLQRDQNDENHDYEEIMKFCLGIKVIEDATSSKLCTKCFNKILDFYEFKALAIKNNAHLISELPYDCNDGTIKVEYLEEDLSDNEINYGDEPLSDHVKSETEADLTDNELLSVKGIKQDFDNDDLLVVIKNKENVVKIPKLTARPKVKDKPGKTKKSKNKVKKEPKVKVKRKLEPKKICDICGKEVRYLAHHLYRHRPTDTQPNFICDYCGKNIYTKAALRAHIRMKHTSVPQKCNICGLFYKNLNTHKKVRHNHETLPFGCTVCGKGFISRPALAYHTTLHTKEKPFECDICHNRYRGKYNLIMHKRRVHDLEKSFVCEICSMAFFKKYALQIHYQSQHANEKRKKAESRIQPEMLGVLECQVCNKMFKTKNTLRNHLSIHIGDKKYQCTLCGKRFIRASYLSTHMLGHTRVKKYPCQYCDAKFHRPDTKKKHEVVVHLKPTVNKKKKSLKNIVSGDAAASSDYKICNSLIVTKTNGSIK